MLEVWFSGQRCLPGGLALILRNNIKVERRRLSPHSCSLTSACEMIHVLVQGSHADTYSTFQYIMDSMKLTQCDIKNVGGSMLEGYGRIEVVHRYVHMSSYMDMNI